MTGGKVNHDRSAFLLSRKRVCIWGIGGGELVGNSEICGCWIMLVNCIGKESLG